MILKTKTANLSSFQRCLLERILEAILVHSWNKSLQAGQAKKKSDKILILARMAVKASI